MRRNAIAPPPPAAPTRAAVRPLRRAWQLVLDGADRLATGLPLLLMALFAAGSWWLVRITPAPPEASAPREVRHEPDYFMKQPSVRFFDAGGRLTRELEGDMGHHYPDTDETSFERARIRDWDEQGALTTATANLAISNGDGTHARLLGDARVVREAGPGRPLPMELRGQSLHGNQVTRQFTSPEPVELIRGNDVFRGDALHYDEKTRVLNLKGQVRGTIQPRAPATHAKP